VRLVRAWTQRRGKAAGRAGTDFWLPSPPVNALLTAVFAGEATRLTAALRSTNSFRPIYRAGASLVALLRREETNHTQSLAPSP
jgi:hypothetical protein